MIQAFKIVILSFLMGYASNALAQSEEIKNTGEFRTKPTFLRSDEMPFLPVCAKLFGKEQEKCTEKAITRHITSHLAIPQEVIDSLKSVNERIYVQFIVDQSGWATDITILKGKTPALIEACKTAIANLPRFQPGKTDGVEVAVQYILPIVIKF